MVLELLYHLGDVTCGGADELLAVGARGSVDPSSFCAPRAVFAAEAMASWWRFCPSARTRLHLGKVASGLVVGVLGVGRRCAGGCRRVVPLFVQEQFVAFAGFGCSAADLAREGL